MTHDVGRGLLDPLRHFPAAQSGWYRQEQLNAIGRDRNGIDGPAGQVADVPDIPLAESGVSGYFEQLSTAMRGAHDVTPFRCTRWCWKALHAVTLRRAGATRVPKFTLRTSFFSARVAAEQ
jgi:hypothetical protein